MPHTMPDTTQYPPATTDTLLAWLTGRAMPLWLRHGLDRHAGGYHEFLAADGYACDASFRRLRVVARQIFVFSHAHRLGVAGADEAAFLGVTFLARHASLPDGGYAWRFDLTNRPTDMTRDLYDHAFVLLALASATAVLPAASLRPRALALMAFLDQHMAHQAGGYSESIPASLPRRQNPHMHLLEAVLAAHAAFGDGVFLDRACALVGLVLGRLIDPATGALPENFDDDWRPEAPGGVFRSEPGHHCEWAWLLHDFARHAGPSAAGEAQAGRLLAFVDAHAAHPVTHDLIDQVASDGTQVARSARLWPQAERLKAAFLRPDRSGVGKRAALDGLAAWLRPDGLWHERRTEDGHFLPGPSAATSLYHLTSAILTAAAAPD
jgi:mannose/cellobiose epimerase-like protein (N-acyl-D-glucosamine 2-epimerase family)